MIVERQEREWDLWVKPEGFYHSFLFLPKSNIIIVIIKFWTMLMFYTFQK